MKTAYKLIIVLVLSFAQVIAPSLTGGDCFAQTIGEAFYIYRNDGNFNAFFRDEVDSIAYSCYDADSTLYNDIVTQIVYTPDSTYLIPLAAIDSVSFVQPETEYKLDVMRMNEGWLPYVCSVSDNSITFSTNTPSEYLPVVGQVLVTETFEEPFTLGFSGRVTNIVTNTDGIVCIVEEVGLSDIYDHIVSVGVSSSTGESDVKGDVHRRIWGMNMDKGVRFPLPHLDASIGPFSVSCDPSVVMKYVVCVGERNLKDYVSIQVYTILNGSASMEVKREKEYHPEPIWKFSVPINTSIPGLYGRVRVGGFFRASGKVDLSATLPFVINGYSSFVKAEGQPSQRKNRWSAQMGDLDAEISLDGVVSGGVAVQLQFGIIHEKIASADITAYVGPKLSAHFSLTAEGLVDRTLYSALKNSEVKLDFGAEIVPGYRFWGGEHQETPVSLNLGYNINHWYIVPEFTNLEYEKQGSSGFLMGDIRRNLLPKVSLGWGLYDNEDNLYTTYYFPEPYRKLEDWPQNGLSYHLTDLPSGTAYTAYPLVKLFNCEMRADQSVDVFVAPKLVTGEVTDVKGSTATCAGYVEGLKFGTVVDAGICYADNPEAEDWMFASAHAREDGDFSVELTGLHGNTTYYYCVYACIDGEYYYADDVKSFTTSFPAAITNFEVTNSQYKVGGFTNDGQQYDYKFNVAVTAEIESLENVYDWGYVYVDPNGRKKEISLKSHGTSYKDTSYAYYRSDPHSTCRLYCYVKYEDGNVSIYEDPVDYNLDCEVSHLELSSYELSLQVGVSATIQVISGSGSYSAIVQNNKVTASISGNTITIQGKSTGSTVVTISDNNTNERKTIITVR